MYVFSAELWQYDGPSAWYFVSLPPDIADDIRAEFGAQAGWLRLNQGCSRGPIDAVDHVAVP